MRYAENARRHRPALISRIRIEKLFGRYDYELNVPRKGHDSNIVMIYGDNGRGKTTILQLLFHLLSPHMARGHKTYIARTPFSKFSVTFTDKTRIDVSREASNLSGEYKVQLIKADSASSAVFRVNKEMVVLREHISPKEEQVIQEISDLAPSVFLISDDRMLQSDELPIREPTLGEMMRSEEGLRVGASELNLRDKSLQDSLERANMWLRRRLIRRATKGATDALNIYVTIVDEINKKILPPKEYDSSEKDDLIKELGRLEKRSRSFAELGLNPRVNAKRLISSVNETNPKEFPIVSQVVSSFIDGQRARLDALEDLRIRLDAFIRLINGFLVDKAILFEVGEGISIKTDDGIVLDSQALSSGEKQLLLLFCNVLASSESAALFLIDEPEISLNVKWQRKLVDALIEIIQGTQCQFLLATHSIELLTRHKEQVMQLDPL